MTKEVGRRAQALKFFVCCARRVPTQDLRAEGSYAGPMKIGNFVNSGQRGFE